MLNITVDWTWTWWVVLVMIVDITIRALSPSTNDPTTAVHGLSHVSALLGELVAHPPRPSAFRDDDGHVYIADRAKDMLIYKGYNVYPRELEEILVTHPDVAQAAVVAREAGVVGQEPVAFVVARDGREVDVDAVMTYVAEQVLPYKKIRDVVVIDALPTSAAGKIQKVALRTRLRESEELHHA